MLCTHKSPRLLLSPPPQENHDGLLEQQKEALALGSGCRRGVCQARCYAIVAKSFYENLRRVDGRERTLPESGHTGRLRG